MIASNRLGALTQAQRDRLAYIELSLQFLGKVSREQLVDCFRISSPTATRDLALYKKKAAHNLLYVAKSKEHVRGENGWFKPLFDFSARRVLAWLTEGHNDGEELPVQSVVACADTALLETIDLNVLSVVTRAIRQRVAVEVVYLGLSSGRRRWQIVPFALVNGGTRWYVRAFDRNGQGFRDFALARLDNAHMLPGAVAVHETMEQDIHWHRTVELELVPHPANAKYPEAVEAEFGMNGGRLKITVRSAVAGHWLRHWRVDSSDDHSLRGAEHLLWLRNRRALHGVDNLAHVPGYR